VRCLKLVPSEILRAPAWMMRNVNGVMLPGLASTVSPRQDFRCLALNRNGLLSSLEFALASPLSACWWQ
jgi:hypothetical protein